MQSGKGASKYAKVNLKTLYQGNKGLYGRNYNRRNYNRGGSRTYTMKKDYEDIINLPHHVSDRHKAMSMMDRAAQFAPFAALTGYEALIQKAGAENAVSEDSVILSDEYMDIP